MDLGAGSVSKKLKQQSQVGLCEVVEVGGDDASPTMEVLIVHDEDGIGDKGKSKLGYDDALDHPDKDASSSDLGNGVVVSGDNANHGSLSSDNNNNINNNSGLNSDEEVDDEELLDGNEYLEDDGCDYDDNNDYYYEDDEDDYLLMQSQFDNVDLPAGVEIAVSVPWLQSSASSGNASGSGSSSSGARIHFGGGSNATLSYPAKPDEKETSSDPSEIKSQVTSPGASTVPTGSSSVGELEENLIIQKWKSFKQFDTVEDFSDHHYKGTGFIQKQPPKNWAKRIQEEWKILEDLPETISVRVCESRMELLRAVIEGPAGTPYHDGLFVFDCLFPEAYPNEPPLVYYYSGGLRLNPNLYECGKVCLSLLGTWSGKQNELWIPGKSTMLQVLVSIQALILNERPFFNEPGHDSLGAEGHKRSTQYSEEVFVLSLKTMIYTLRRPPKYFEDLVSGHFHSRARDILMACKAYADGAAVGNVTIKDGVAQVNEADKIASNRFRTAVKKMINVLVASFTRYASIECEDFRISD